MNTPYQDVTDKTGRIASYYEQHAEAQLEEVSRGERDTIEIDCTELHACDPALFDSLCSYGSYDAVVDWFQRAAADYPPEEDFTQQFKNQPATSIIADAFPDDNDVGDEDEDDDGGEDESESRFDVPDDVDVSLVNFPEEARVEIGEPQTEDFGRLIALRGVVRQVSSPRTLVKTAEWECQRCGTQHSVPVEIGNMKKPSVCDWCEEQVSWSRVPAQEKRVDYQELHLQEEPGEAIDQSNPRTMTIRIEGTELTDAATPGERVEVRGVMEEDMSDEMAVLIDGYVTAADIDTESEDFDSLEIGEEEAVQYEAMSDRVDMEQLCVESLAPNVYGEETAKRAIVYQLFGGVSYFSESAERDTEAGEIHLAFIGDPGTVKSTLASAARRVSPRAVKAVGKGMTAAGMTASAVQKEIAGSQEWTLQAGALVLADKGVITIDELDKANDEVQKSLHEAMSEQVVSVAKASINESLPTRVSALLIANPKHGRFDEFEPVAEQFNLDSALLDRADMVLSFVDDPDEDLDRKIARQNLSYGMEGDGSDDVPDDVGALDLTADGLLTTESFRRYVAYAKGEYNPTMTTEARDKLEDFYATIRALSEDGEVSLSARAVDSLRKFAEARARMQLRDEITLEDAEAVVEMYMEMYKDMGLDPDSGQFSASLAEGTRGASKRESTKDAIRTAIDELSDYSGGDLATREEVVEAVQSEEDVDGVINKMLDSGSLYQPAADKLAVNN